MHQPTLPLAFFQPTVNYRTHPVGFLTATINKWTNTIRSFYSPIDVLFDGGGAAAALTPEGVLFAV